jgi:hypothetical protein
MLCLTASNCLLTMPTRLNEGLCKCESKTASSASDDEDAVV